jgi:outer membrane protein assembly factor BamD
MFGAALAVSAIGCGATTIPVVRSEGERLEVARQMMARRQWVIAADLLKTFIANNPGNASIDEAIFRLGETYLHLKDWPSAAVEFERLLRDYPESDSSGSAAMRLGDALFGQTRPTDFDQEYTRKALEQWQSYLRAYPGHWLNGEALGKVAAARRRLASKLLDTGRLYEKQGYYDPSRIYFERVERDYGDLDIVADAWIGLARLDARQGHNDRALERLRRVEERFPGTEIAVRAARERTRLER